MTWHNLGVNWHNAETRILGVRSHNAEKRSIFENCFARSLFAKNVLKKAKLQKFHGGGRRQQRNWCFGRLACACRQGNIAFGSGPTCSDGVVTNSWGERGGSERETGSLVPTFLTQRGHGVKVKGTPNWDSSKKNFGSKDRELLFSFFFCKIDTVALSFVFNKYCPICGLSSKDSSHKLQINYVISCFLSIIAKVPVRCNGKKEKISSNNHKKITNYQKCFLLQCKGYNLEWTCHVSIR